MADLFCAAEWGGETWNSQEGEAKLHTNLKVGAFLSQMSSCEHGHGSENEKRRKLFDSLTNLPFDWTHTVNSFPLSCHTYKWTQCLYAWPNVKSQPTAQSRFVSRWFECGFSEAAPNCSPCHISKAKRTSLWEEGEKKETFQLAIQLSNYFIMCWRAGRRMAMCFLSSSVLPLVVMTTASILFSLSPTVSYSAALNYLCGFSFPSCWFLTSVPHFLSAWSCVFSLSDR